MDEQKTMSQIAGDLMAAMSGVAQRDQRPAQMAMGEVLAGTQEGLRLRCMGLEIGQEDIRINENLLAGYSPKLVGDLPGTCPDGGTMTPVTRDQLSRGEFALKAGDQVVVFSEDGQIFTILCKVVSL